MTEEEIKNFHPVKALLDSGGASATLLRASIAKK
jgi:hypothetical protein